MTNNGSHSSAEKPLAGALFCCTSIPTEQRSQLAEWAQEMGADHTLDLTSDVTHLLVGNTDSEKYRYVARERSDVRVLLPEFLAAARELWMNDQPLDLSALEAQYKCPILHGLRISLTGFDDIPFRDELARNIVQSGGQYSGDLTRDVTHLVAHAPRGKKYEYATSWGLKIVSIKWYKDTRDRGMQLDESKYHPTITPEEQGVGAWTRRGAGPKLGKRQRAEPVEEKATRKLRRTASARFESQQNDMWNDIVAPPRPETLDPVENGLQHTKSMPNFTAPDVNVQRTFDEPAGHEQVAHQPHQPQQPLTDPKSAGIFSGKHFVCRGFDARRKPILHHHLSGHGGTLLSSLAALKIEAEKDASKCFVVVAHQITNTQLACVEQGCHGISIVTELWLEYCISSQTFVQPEDYVLGLPAVTTNVPAVSKLIVNATGFPGIQALHVSKIIRKVGASYAENFTSATSLVVCNSSNLNQQKLEYAKLWGLPVVSEEWLWQFIRTSRLPSYESFLIQPTATVQAKSDTENAANNQTIQKQPPKERCSTAQKTNRTQSAVQPNTHGLEHNSLSDGFEQENTHPIANVPNVSRDGQGFAIPISKHIVREGHEFVPIPLQELSTNVPAKQPDSTKVAKKKLFQSYDGHFSDQAGPAAQIGMRQNDSDMSVQMHDDETLQAEPSCDQLNSEPQLSRSQETRNHSNLISEFLQIKAASEARAAAEAKDQPDLHKANRKLLGRALSNLSNSSKKSNDNNESSGRAGKQPLSRASSINSVNTDGLGMPLSMMSRIPSNLKNKNDDTVADQGSRPQKITLEGNAARTRDNTDTATIVRPETKGMSADAFAAALTAFSTSQVPRPPSPSQKPAQLSYADSDAATALKAHLANKRRTRAKLGQKQNDPGPDLSREESEEKRQREWRERELQPTRGRRSEGTIDLTKLKDDEAVVGRGRRTRGREKALNKLLGDEEVGVGDLF